MIAPFLLETFRPDINTRNYFDDVLGAGMWSERASLEGAPPALMTEDGLAGRLGEAVVQMLAPRIEEALEFWARRVGFEEGEELVSREMVGLAETWGGLAEGTIGYLRSTNLARAVFFSPGARIDLATGALIDPGPEAVLGTLAASAPPPAGLLGSDFESDIGVITEAGLSALTIVGFGISGPWGLALAGAASVGEVLFSAFFDAKGPSTAEVVVDAVERLMEREQISALANDIATSMSVFESNWSQLKGADTLQLDGFRQAAQNQIQDTSPLNTAINQLSGNNPVSFMDAATLRKQAVSLYAYAISVKLLWLKVLILLDDSPRAAGNKTLSSYLPWLVDAGEAGSRCIAETVKSIEDEIADRVAAVGPCRKTYIEPSRSKVPDSKSLYETGFPAYAFQDSKDPWAVGGDIRHFKAMVIPNTGCCQQNAHEGTCEKKRRAYIDALRAGIIKELHYDSADVARLSAKLAATVAQYKPFVSQAEEA